MFTQLVRVGRDAELRYTQSGKAVCSVACAYDIGWGDKKRTQWIECALWEKRAESLAQYLLKGQQIVVTLDDVEIEVYESQKGPGHKLRGRVVDLKLCGPKPESNGHPQQQATRTQPAQQTAPAGMDDFDDDIPF